MKSPAEVQRIESLRIVPYCRMFGCAEFEQVARSIVNYLVEHGDEWCVEVPLIKICDSWQLLHFHNDIGTHDFIPRFYEDGKVTRAFLDCVTREGDGQEFRDDVLRRWLE